MQNKPNFPKSQMFITVISTMNYNEKLKLDTWSKQTQTKPIYSEPVEPTKPTCSELACTEQGRSVEPILSAGKEFKFFNAQGVP
jgi:hypothetical protein